MQKFALRPEYSGYSSDPALGMRMYETEGGAPRQRAGFVNNTWRVSVSVPFVTQTHASYVTAFLQHHASNRAASPRFLMDLLLEAGTLVERQCSIVPGSVSITAANFGRSYLKMTLDVVPDPIDLDYNESLVTLFTEYAGDAYTINDVLNLLAELVNVDMPENMGG